MKVISKTTLVTGSDEGPVDHEPGTPVDLPKAEAEDLIARGIVTAAGNAQAAPEPGDSNPININEADAKALVTIKGVGKATAGDIVASREADGPFESLDQCAERVGGVSLEQLEAAGATV